MKVHQTELLSALVDGELRGRRKRLVERHLQECIVCQAEFRHLQHVREMLAANPPQPAMSDSADFFWSKVKREIERHGNTPVEAPVAGWSLADWLLQHSFALATTAAVVLALLVGVLFLPRQLSAPTVVQVATALPDTAATPLEPDEEKTTTIWLSGLPWTKDMNQMQTYFSDPET
jgi:anti-sigma factor RsiW